MNKKALLCLFQISKLIAVSGSAIFSVLLAAGAYVTHTNVRISTGFPATVVAEQGNPSMEYLLCFLSVFFAVLSAWLSYLFFKTSK